MPHERHRSNRSPLRFAAVLAGLLALLVTIPPAPAGAGGPPILVTNANDSGGGSLRDAISIANANPGTEIEFAIPGCPPACTISLVTLVPTITADHTTIDATTQPGYNGTPLVTLDGSAIYDGPGIWVQADYAVIRGLRVQNFPGDGINLAGSGAYGHHLVEDNALLDNNYGIAASGEGDTMLNNVADGNEYYGILGNGTPGAEITGNTVTNNGYIGIQANGEDMTITGNTVSGNTEAGIFTAAGGAPNAIISGNVVTNQRGRGIFHDGPNGTVSGNVVSGNDWEGIIATAFGGETVVSGNTVTGNGGGGGAGAAGRTPGASGGPRGDEGPTPGISATGQVSISGNLVAGNRGPGISSSGSEVQAHFNRIVNNDTAAAHYDTGILDAENNWWGCNEGPGNDDCGYTEGAVDYGPWLVLRLTPSAASLQVGGSAGLTADVVMNSDGSDTSPDGNIPDGADVLFETDLGSVGSASVVKTLVDGAAEATLVPDTPGVAHVSATLDSETVTAEVVVTGAGSPTPTGTPPATPTPTGTPSGTKLGDTDCDEDVDSVDALWVLKDTAGLPHSAACIAEGDVDCDDDRDSVDALKVLRHVAGMGNTVPPGCTPIGA